MILQTYKESGLKYCIWLPIDWIYMDYRALNGCNTEECIAFCFEMHDMNHYLSHILSLFFQISRLLNSH